MGDKVVLPSFIYSTCSDVNGCPLATAVLHKIKNRLKKEPELAEKLRLVTLSFNPEHDTPEMMQHYGQELQDKGVEWRFLTTQSEQDLQPILAHYKQNIQKVYNAQGKFTGTFSHILRVYLIDKNKQLRNIYSVAFLHPDTLINDIKTLLQTEPTQAAAHFNRQKSVAHTDLYSPGYNKSNYEHSNYQTHSVALTDRVGQTTNLLKTLKKPPLGLPVVPVPANNRLTKEKINLGRKLFYDRRLSLNNTFSCAMCHVPEQGFTSNEMANPSIGYVIEKIYNSADYNGLFRKAFGKEPGMENIGMAIASYERTLNSANSAFDRWYYGKDKQALDGKAQRGFQLFNGKASYSSCHSITRNHALFNDNNNHNTGIGYAEAMDKTDQTRRVQVSPSVYVDVAATVIRAVAEAKTNDLGRYEVTQKPEDRWKYKTPSLRNVSLTGPYMHNGAFATLQRVVEFYNRGGIANENLDPLIKPLNLTEPEIADLTVFLESLTGDNVKELVADAFAAPIGDTQ